MKTIKASMMAVAVVLIATTVAEAPYSGPQHVRDTEVQVAGDALLSLRAVLPSNDVPIEFQVADSLVAGHDVLPDFDTVSTQVETSVAASADFVGPAPSDDQAVPADDAPSSRSPRSKMSGPVAALAEAGGPGMVEIVARYDERPELFDDAYVASLGGKVTRGYATLDMRAISIPASSLEALATDENVDWLSLDDQMSVTSSAHQAMNIPVSTSPNFAYSGSSIGIAVLDTGVSAHNDLDGNILQYSFLNGAYPIPEIVNGEVVTRNDSIREDLFGHGTHVAGILSGSGTASGGSHEGVAKQAPVLSLQVLDGNGGGSMSDVMAALDWLLVYGSYFDIRVVNLSLGKGISESNTTDPLVIAVENLWDAGMVVVVAAGNDGFSGAMTINSPANSRKVITVGSLTDSGTGTDYSDDFVSSFSSTGPTVGDLVMKPDLVAPGNRIVAAVSSDSLLAKYLPARLTSACSGIVSLTTGLSTAGSSKSGCTDAYLQMSGTSMATPMVAAAVALMLEKDPTLTPATVKARLMRSARKLDALPTAIGTGLLDVEAALNDTGLVSGEALSPLVTYDATLEATLIEDTGELWGAETWSASYLYQGGVTLTTGDGTADGGVTASGYGWTDSAIAANGYGWTGGGVHANGYGWTNAGGVKAKGYGWTNAGVKAKSLLDTGIDGGGVINDDPDIDPNP